MSLTNIADTGTKKPSFRPLAIEITNDTESSLDIYDVNGSAEKGQTAHNTYTKLGTIAAKTVGFVETIRNPSSVRALYTGMIPELQNWFFHQFPIKLMSGTRFSFGDPPPPKYTITEADRQSMIQSYLFHKFAMANPDSALTKSLNTALKSGDFKAVNAFFAGTQSFKSCTMSSWNAIMTWLTDFTSGWQGPYYIYERPPSPLPPSYTPTFLGVLQIKSTADEDSAILTLGNLSSRGNEASPTIRLLDPPQRSTVVMVGDGTMMDGNPGQDIPLSLTPIWINVLQTSAVGSQPQTTYISGPAVFGTIAGKNVISQQKLLPSPKHSSRGGQSGPSGSEDLWQSFGKICEIAGLIVSVSMIYEMIQKKYEKKEKSDEQAKERSTSEQELKYQQNQIEEGTANDIKQDIEQSQLTSDNQAITTDYSEAANLQREAVMQTTLNTDAEEFVESINEQLENGLTPSDDFNASFGNAETQLATAQSQIEQGDLGAATDTLHEAASSMRSTADLGAADMGQTQADALSASADAVRDAAQTAESIDAAQSQYEQATSEQANDSGAPKQDITPETEDVSVAEFGA